MDLRYGPVKIAVYGSPMVKRRYADTQRARAMDTRERVLAAAEELVRSGAFHAATVEELADKAEVSRATIFARFGTRLGILEALNERCNDSPEIAALGQALQIDDPLTQLDALIHASCRVWEAWGDVQRHLRAVVILEPGVRPLIEDQRRLQSEVLGALARRLDDSGLLASGLSPKRAGITLHMLTGLEAFTELRREGGLSLAQTIATTRDLAHSLLAAGPTVQR
jgi:AcrR family transcriptional regulator